MFCIPKVLIEKFKLMLKNKEITPEKLIEMSSKERREFFSQTLGDLNAQKANALFESKLLLKNQQKGIINWAKKITGISKETRNDMISRVERLGEVLTPETEKAFLNDLINQRLSVNVTMKEAANIMELSKDVKAKREAMDAGADRMEYGRARVEFEDYVNGLKDEAKALKLKDYIKPENYGTAFVKGFGFLKSIKAIGDNSVIGRQGLAVMFKNPKIWAKNAVESFRDIYRVFKGEDVMKEIRADIISRENAVNGLYKKEKLAVGVTEEAFPTSLPEKIPFAGRVFKASETAFTGFLYRSRADIFDLSVKVAKKSDADIKGLGWFINSLTGRGNLGKLEPAANVANVLFFSPRFAKSRLDLLTFHIFEHKNYSPFVRKQAAEASLKMIGGIATILAITEAINPDLIEWDPRSSNFGKIKVGNTRFDITAGLGSYVTLASRIIPSLWGNGYIKSSTTGVLRKINDKDEYKGASGWEVLTDWIEGKTSPGVSFVKMMLSQETYEGDPLTLGNLAFELLSPIIASNVNDLAKDPRSANMVLAILADFTGIGASTYGPEVDWHVKTTQEMIQFKEEKGAESFKQANKDYNEMYVEWLERAKSDDRFKGLDNDQKIKLLQKKRAELKDKIFRKYHFKPKKERSERLPRII